MKRIRKITMLVGVVGLVVIGANVASAADESDAPAKRAAAFAGGVDRWDASEQWKGSGSGAAADRVAGLQLLAAGFDDRVLPASASSSYRSQAGVELVAVPTEKGGLCFGSARAGKPLSAACAPHFDEPGTVLIYRHETGAPDEVSGVVADGVTSMIATLDDGSTHELDHDAGTVVWTAPADRVIDAIVSTRGGKRYIQSFTDRH